MSNKPISLDGEKPSQAPTVALTPLEHVAPTIQPVNDMSAYILSVPPAAGSVPATPDTPDTPKPKAVDVSKIYPTAVEGNASLPGPGEPATDAPKTIEQMLAMKQVADMAKRPSERILPLKIVSIVIIINSLFNVVAIIFALQRHVFPTTSVISVIIDISLGLYLLLSRNKSVIELLLTILLVLQLLGSSISSIGLFFMPSGIVNPLEQGMMLLSFMFQCASIILLWVARTRVKNLDRINF